MDVLLVVVGVVLGTVIFNFYRRLVCRFVCVR